MGVWYIRVHGQRRKEIDIHLLAQAVIALAEHLEAEETEQAANAGGSGKGDPTEQRS